MRSWICWSAIIACLSLSQASCFQSGRPPIVDKVPLSHVRGRVLVDGLPKAGVHIQYVPQGEIAETRERYTNRFFLQSGEGGKFSLSTYVNGDGIPYGDYVLEFKWLEQRLSGEVDRLGGMYSDATKPFITIQVTKDHDIDLGDIKLETLEEKLKEPE